MCEWCWDLSNISKKEKNYLFLFPCRSFSNNTNWECEKVPLCIYMTHVPNTSFKCPFTFICYTFLWLIHTWSYHHVIFWLLFLMLAPVVSSVYFRYHPPPIWPFIFLLSLTSLLTHWVFVNHQINVSDDVSRARRESSSTIFLCNQISVSSINEESEQILNF